MARKLNEAQKLLAQLKKDPELKNALIEALLGEAKGKVEQVAEVEEVRVLRGRVTHNRLGKLYYEEGVRKVQIGKVTYELSTDSDGLVYKKEVVAEQIKSGRKGAPSDEENGEDKEKELNIRDYTGKVNFEEETLKVLLPYFEPKKYDGFYRWGGKHDGYNQKSYMGRRKAFCVYMATNGKYIDSQKAYDAGVRIDYSEGGAYYKAKAEFEKMFKYVKTNER